MGKLAGPMMIAVFAVAVAAGPGPGDKAKKEAPPPPPPPPPLNLKVAEFARSSLGRPVGDGVCITLPAEALRSAGARPPSFDDPDGNYTWGDPVADLKDALPGDILQFRDAVFNGRRTLARGRWESWHSEYPHHSAVVAKVEQGGKLITVYHQNVAIDGRAEAEKGNVREDLLRMDSLQKGGWIKAYRPAAASTKSPGM